ncbi:MAG: ribulose-phosphate 3-epimerase [bacterium]|nr:ribulose-phosphate 3-epimerase [bacterium]
MMQKVIPAILTQSPEELRRQLQALKEHAKWVQIDIMDGKFVPSVSVNISELGEASQFFNLEIHLMVENPETYLEDCSAVGAKRVYFHLEGTKDPLRVLSLMEQYRFQRGVAINPETKIASVAPLLENMDALLLLSVVPGAQGHKFIPEAAGKAAEAKALKEDLLVGVDGGISEDNILGVFEKGADYAAVGSSVWKAEDPILALKNLSEMVS